MNRFTSSIAATTVWLAMASVLLQSIVGLACDCECHVSSTFCVALSCHAEGHAGHGHAVCDHESVEDREQDDDDSIAPSTCCHTTQLLACDIESAHFPSSGGCPECCSVHEAPIATLLPDSTRVDRDESLNIDETASDSGFGTRLLEAVCSQDLSDRTVVGITSQISCAIFCRFTI